jgi:hypothetical protein
VRAKRACEMSRTFLRGERERKLLSQVSREIVAFVFLPSPPANGTDGARAQKHVKKPLGIFGGGNTHKTSLWEFSAAEPTSSLRSIRRFTLWGVAFLSQDTGCATCRMLWITTHP